MFFSCLIIHTSITFPEKINLSLQKIWSFLKNEGHFISKFCKICLLSHLKEDRDKCIFLLSAVCKLNDLCHQTCKTRD